MNTRPLLMLHFFGAGLLLSACAPQNAFQPPPPPQVTVAPPERQDVIVHRTFPGRLESVESVEVRARVRGFLEEVLFEDGERVDKDQVLFIIEQAPFAAALQSAQAQQAQAQAGKSLAEAALERKKRAFANKAVSELDILSAEADVEAATAAVQAAEAAVQQAELDLSYATITAPISGRIARHLVSTGNLVGGAEATLLTTLLSEDPIDCYGYVDERTALTHPLEKTGSGATGDASATDATLVKLELADGSIYGEEGIIDYVDTSVEVTTGTLKIRARFPNPDNALSAGMFGKIMFPVEFKDALLVPELSVQRDMVGPYVLTVNAENTVESKYVELGPRHKDMRIIGSGLEADDEVVIGGLQRARPGIEVQTGDAASGEGN